MTTTLPTLYKRNSNATAVQQWTISVTNATITTTYGQVGGAMQTTSDTITEGKNLGKKNATTAEQQALLEAQARWEKTKKKGYVETLDAAQAGEVDALIEGGIVPMLAKVYEDRADKITFPVAVQPKLDGHRCVAVVVVSSVDDVYVSLWSRTRKPIKSMPHIVAELRRIFLERLVSGNLADGTYHVDGELYAHSHRDSFEVLTSLIRPDEPRPGHEQVEYHVYDFVSADNFLERFRKHEHTFSSCKYVKLVETHVAADEAALLNHYEHFRRLGYEGAMCRTLDTPYEHKRSASLLKMKDFVDAEAKIVGVEEGRGKLQGHVGAFVCEMLSGKTFKCKLAGETAKLKEAFEHQDEWIGRHLRYKYQGLTADGLPRFPTGLCRVD